MSRISTHRCDWCHHGEPDGTCTCIFKCDSCGTEYRSGRHLATDCVKVLVAPEPEVPEEIKDLLTVDSSRGSSDAWNNAVIEAFRRGQKSVSR